MSGPNIVAACVQTKPPPLACVLPRKGPLDTRAPQKWICHVTDRLIQPQLWLTYQEPITVGDGTRGGREDRIDYAGQCGVEVEGGKVPTQDWFLNLQILTSGGFR